MKTVLLIEDDPEFLRTLRLLLWCQGYNVTPSIDIASAMEMIDTRFDFILCEISLPTHQSFLQFAKKIDPKIQFIFISSTSSQDVMQKALQHGASCMIKKPIDHEILHATLLALEILNK